MRSKKCIKCNKEKVIKFFYTTTRNKTGYKNTCKECIAIYDKKYREKNKLKILTDSKEYYKKNKKASYLRSKKYYKKNKELICQQIKEKKKKDSLYKLKCSLRCRTTNAFKSSKWIKTNTLKNILGGEYDIVKKHLTDSFKEGMSWNNHGRWHIDHIIPLSSATSKEELIKLCHYTNLQALWAEDNLKKGNT